MEPNELITQIYVGYFDRAPDPAGLNYWIGRYNDGMTLAEIAQSFSVQPEATSNYPYLAAPNVASSTAFITSVYANLFNRTPDAAGLAYWEGQLANGTPVGEMILDIISGAVTNPDAAILANKVEVGLDWAVTAANTVGFTYDAAAAASAEGVLDGVTDTQASVDAAMAETDAYFAGGIVGDDFVLTTAIAEEIVGSGNNDTISAIIDGTANTFNAGDSIDGAAGTDTFNLYLEVAGSSAPAGGSVTGVEIVNLISDGTGTFTTDGANIDAEYFEGVRQLWQIGATSGAAVLNVGADTVVGFSGTAVAAADAVTVADGVSSAAVALQGVTSGSTVAFAETTAGDLTEVSVSGSVAGAAAALTIDVTTGGAATVEDVNVNLSSDTTLTFVDATPSIVTIDASASTGDLTIDAATDGLTTVETITTGSGDDTITTAGAVDEIVVGGQGADSIIITAGSTTTIVVNAGDSGITLATADDVTGFVVGTDELDFNLVAGSATNFISDSSAGGFLDALVNANAAFASDANLRYAAVDDGTDTWVFVNRDGDADADQVVELTGVTGVTFGDIIA